MGGAGLLVARKRLNVHSHALHERRLHFVRVEEEARRDALVASKSLTGARRRWAGSIRWIASGAVKLYASQSESGATDMRMVKVEGRGGGGSGAAGMARGARPQDHSDSSLLSVCW